MKMKMKRIKIIGFGLFSIIILAFIASFSITAFEIYLTLSNKNNNVALYETEYYGEVLTEDPYSDFITQYFHPYYVFSLPWKKEDLNKVKENNSDVVLIDSSGFRSISKKQNDYKKIIFLGGSSAFGHYSTSNDTTIGSYLNNLSQFEVINRNAPSWNSHQEAVALFKFNQLNEVAASISFSLGNDIYLACYGPSRYSDEFQDFPESWDQLNEKVNDIRGKVHTISLSRKIKNMLQGFFPNVYSLLVDIKEEKLLSKTVQDFDQYGSCYEKNINEVAASFLSNQKRMSKISKAYGFSHFLIIQPHREASNFRKKVIKNVMNSEYCFENPCLDLSSLFNNMGFYLESYDSISSNPKLVEKWLESGIFQDALHINDKGNDIVSKKINDFLNSYNISD
jgi:hypothetical protein